MGKPTEETRLFQIGDTLATEDSKTKLQFFIRDKVDFVAFDASFDGDYEIQWQKEIDDAESIASDSTIVNQQNQMTLTVNSCVVACKSHFKTMKYFIEKAFPENKAIWHEFGYDHYKKATRSHHRMIQFMKELEVTIQKYSTQLLAANISQDKIDALKPLHENLDNANQQQELYKKSRPVITQERIARLNKHWQRVLQVNKASKIIYVNNFAKFKQYVLIKPGGGDDSSGTNGDDGNGSDNNQEG